MGKGVILSVHLKHTVAKIILPWRVRVVHQSKEAAASLTRQPAINLLAVTFTPSRGTVTSHNGTRSWHGAHMWGRRAARVT